MTDANQRDVVTVEDDWVELGSTDRDVDWAIWGVDQWNDRPAFDPPANLQLTDDEVQRIERRAQRMYLESLFVTADWGRLPEAERERWRREAFRSAWLDRTLLYGPLGDSDPDGLKDDRAELDKAFHDYLEERREQH